MIFQLNQKGDAILHPEAVQLIPELKKLKGPELLFIILAFDYYSPFHQLPEDERIRKAGRKALNVEDYKIIEAPEKIKQAIDYYRSLQYDTRREMMLSYQTKLADIRIKLFKENDTKRITALDELATRLMKRVKEMQEDINHSERMDEIRGGGTKSFIEIWQTNMKQFKEEERKRKEIEEQEQQERDALAKETELD